MPDNRTMRERIARLIEPNSWATLGKGLGDNMAREDRRASSLRRADAILAMIDTAKQERG